MQASKPYRLAPTAHEKIWGSTQLEPWFRNTEKKTGEVWFAEAGSPILIKFLFTTENLSVQVHPNDQQAADLELPECRGKAEMWHILRAEPGAKLAMGLTRDVTPDELRTACEDGSIMDLLRWLPAVPGETWFIPAGTIHAIGGGITLAEIQQHSDVTYRLFDYGRGRELHLEKGMSVSDVNSRPEPAGNQVRCPYFEAVRMDIKGETRVGPGFVIMLAGNARLDREPMQPGEVWKLPGSGEVEGECSAVAIEGQYRYE